jgi:pimeloyl-ACP methyl ester carboxylesterase
MDDREARYRGAEARLWRSLGVEPSERRVRLQRIGIDVRVQELGRGDPVLFIHGASTCGSSWAGLVAAMTGHRCLVLDRPGTGLSDAVPGGTRMPATLLGESLVVDVLDALDIDAADLIATSLGGWFAFRAAAGHPGRIKRLVEFGWTPAAGLDRLPASLRLGSVPGLSGLIARMPATDRSVRQMFRQIGLREAVDGGRVSDEAIAAYAALVNHTPTMANELALGRLFVSPIHGLRPGIALSAADAAHIRAPILLLWGEGDPFGGPDAARRFAAALPDARLEIFSGAGHAVWVDRPETAAARTRAFLAPPRHQAVSPVVDDASGRPAARDW